MSRKLDCLLLVLFALLSRTALAQIPVEEKLKLAPKTGQAALVVVETKIDGQMEKTHGDKTKKERLKISREMEFLDVINKVGSSERAKHTIDGSRRYLRYELDENGDQIDPSTAGVTFKLTIRDDGRANLALGDEAYVDREFQQAEVNRTFSLGFGPGDDLILSEDGSVQNFNLQSIAGLLVAAPEPIQKVEGSVRVLERDDEKARIILGGPAKFRLSRRRGSEDVGWSWDLEFRFTVDLKKQRIIAASAAGSVVGDGYDRDTKIQFQGEVKSTIEVDTEPKLEKIAKQKIKLRDVNHRVADTGISFEAPSSYFYADFDGNVGYRYLSSDGGQKRARQLSLRFSRHDSPSDVVDEEDRKWKGNPKTEIEKVSFKGGRGISVAGVSDEGKHLIVTETYAVKGGVVYIRMDIPVVDSKEGLAELKQIRKSVRFEP